ncbi:hypothetical protein MMPV_004352 [Pyropia vietnamensis]
MQCQGDGACPDDDDPMGGGLESIPEAPGTRRAFADRVDHEAEGGGDVGRPPASPLMGMMRRLPLGERPLGGRPPPPPAASGMDRSPRDMVRAQALARSGAPAPALSSGSGGGGGVLSAGLSPAHSGGGSASLPPSSPAGAGGAFQFGDLEAQLDDDDGDSGATGAACAAADGGSGEWDPLPWDTCFSECHDVPVGPDTFRVYATGAATAEVVVLLLHGGGHCALSWARTAQALVADTGPDAVRVVAYDARAHGHTVTADPAREYELSAEQQVDDAVGVVTALCGAGLAACGEGPPAPSLVVVGHSMGGAIATRVVASGRLRSVVGLVVIDVVEGTAVQALPYMSSWLRSRSRSFATVPRAIRYVVNAGHVRRSASARISVPPQLMLVHPPGAAAAAGGDRVHPGGGGDSGGGGSDGAGARPRRRSRWTWRTQLDKSEVYWRGWFVGLSAAFLRCNVAKVLVLAGVDRLDRELMIAQMQGKFQTVMIPSAGHAVHEDEPEATAGAIAGFLRRNLFIEAEGDDGTRLPVAFQQRRPVMPRQV